MDTFGNSRANTCIQTRFMKGCVYQIPNLPTSVVFLVIHDKILIAFGDESFKVSDQSAFDGRVLAYHGSDG